jgi:hypothetical protein
MDLNDGTLNSLVLGINEARWASKIAQATFNNHHSREARIPRAEAQRTQNRNLLLPIP